MTQGTVIQEAFVSGELSPAMWGRVSHEKYKFGASTMRNGFVNFQGGYSSRAGSAFVGQCKQASPFGGATLNNAGATPVNTGPPRPIPFQFNTSQAFDLEFGDYYMRVIYRGAYVTEAAVVVTSVDDTAVFTTATDNNYASGDWIYDVGNDGFSGLIWIVDSLTQATGTYTFTINPTNNQTIILNGVAWQFKTSGAGAGQTNIQGTTALTIAQLVTDLNASANAAIDVATYTGDATTLTITYDAGGSSGNDYTLAAGTYSGTVSGATLTGGNGFTVRDLFGNAIVTATASSGGTVARIYTATTPYAAVDLPYLKYTQSADKMSFACWNQETLTEYPPYDLTRHSNTNWTFDVVSFSSVISAPTNVAATAHSSTTTNTQYSYCVTAIDRLTGSESVASSAVYVKNNDISVNAGSNVVTWSPVAGALGYNIYEATALYNTGAITPQVGIPYGFVGTASGTVFTDTNIIQDFTRTPPLHNNPFNSVGIINVAVTAGGSGLDQSTVGYTVNTSTGSGFSGTPLILAGALNGFLITNTGQGYSSGDTITITGASAAAATGTYDFDQGQPTNNQTISLDNTTWTFVTGASVGNQTTIQGSLAATLNQLISDLNASLNSHISLATYTVLSTVMTITYNTTGTGGNSYTLAAGTYGGTVSGAHLTGGSAGGSGGATVAVTVGPAQTYPGTVAYFQQRRIYASTQNNPDTYFMSRPGDYTNMDSSNPSEDDDAIIGTPWAQQVNGVQFMTPMTGGLVIFTGGGAWQLSGGGTGAAITPADQFAQPQTRYGCSSTVPPIPINFHILFVREGNGVVYDLLYNFFAQVYTGTDITVFSSHLFQGYQIVGWAYAEKPNKLVWAVRNDGSLLSMTYVAEQAENGWARHDTNGLYINICSVEETPVDAVYVIVQRYVNGMWLYYHERFDDRLWTDAEDCFCVDAGLTYPLTFPDATLTASAADGTDNITDTHVVFGGSGYTAPVASAEDTTGAGNGATFSVTVSGGVITAVTPITTGDSYVIGQTRIIITDPTGSDAVVNPIITNEVTFTADSSVFTMANEGDVIRMGNGQATITDYVSGTVVTANITRPITAVLNNDPDLTPIPAISGDWSIATPITVVTGLNHLEGKTVTGLADGGVIAPTVVTNGQITLPVAASFITVGLPFLPQLQALYLEMSSPGNTLQTRRKNIPSVGFRVHNTRGVSVGSNKPDASTQVGQVNVPWTGMQEVKERDQLIPMGDPIQLFTGDYFKNIGPDWNIRGQVAFQQNFPLPLNIDACISYVDVGDSPG